LLSEVGCECFAACGWLLLMPVHGTERMISLGHMLSASSLLVPYTRLLKQYGANDNSDSDMQSALLIYLQMSRYRVKISVKFLWQNFGIKYI
jgi:hypothetical protein